MTDVVVYKPPTSSLELAPQAWKLAEKIANTDFVPTALRNRPEAVLACILAGHEAGVSPMQALAKIHIIEGRPAMAAELMRALVLQHGHELYYEDVSTTAVTAAGKRRGSERWTRVTWTMDDAKRGGLDQKSNWRKWPRAMLIARSTAELCRMVFPDVLAGISYTVEELEDGPTALNGSVVDFGPPELVEGAVAPTPERVTAQAKRTHTRAAPPDDPAPAPQPVRGAVPTLPGEDDPIEVSGSEQHEETPETGSNRSNTAEVTPTEAVGEDWASGDWASGDFPSEPTPEQQRRYTGPQLIAIRLADRFEIKGNSADARTQRISAISALLGRQIESSKDLTPAEIQTVIERLDALPEGMTIADLTPVTAERVDTGPSPDDWPADQWRKLLADRKVTVKEAMVEAHRLGALCDPKVSIATLDEVAGSGIAVALLGFVEDLALRRSAK